MRIWFLTPYRSLSEGKREKSVSMSRASIVNSTRQWLISPPDYRPNNIRWICAQEIKIVTCTKCHSVNVGMTSKLRLSCPNMIKSMKPAMKSDIFMWSCKNLATTDLDSSDNSYKYLYHCVAQNIISVFITSPMKGYKMGLAFIMFVHKNVRDECYCTYSSHSHKCYRDNWLLTVIVTQFYTPI